MLFNNELTLRLEILKICDLKYSKHVLFIICPFNLFNVRYYIMHISYWYSLYTVLFFLQIISTY